MDGGNEVMDGPRLLTEGEWAGWYFWGDGDPFEHQSGPFFFREESDGTTRCAFRAEQKHMNGGGFMHGGCMMTFADYCLFIIARDAIAHFLPASSAGGGDSGSNASRLSTEPPDALRIARSSLVSPGFSAGSVEKSNVPSGSHRRMLRTVSALRTNASAPSCSS